MENTTLQLQEEPAVNLVPASVAKRLLNYFIDVFIFSFLVSFLLMAVAPVYPLMNKIMQKQPLDLGDQLAVWFVYALYMSVMESLLKGKTIGKYITGTRAVDEHGLPVKSETAFLRGLIRFIPFEQVSAFNIGFNPFGLLPPNPWHDRWSKSIVVDEGKSLLPKR